MRTAAGSALVCPVCPPATEDGYIVLSGRSEWRQIARLVALIALAVLLIVGAVLVIAWLSQPGQSWDQTNRQQITSMLADAERLADEGRAQEAYNRYRELEQFTFGQQISDPLLRAQLSNARARATELGEQLAIARARAQDSTAPRPLPAAPPPSPRQPDQAPTDAQAQEVDTPVRPKPQPIESSSQVVGDAQIGQAITAGVNYLIGQFDGDTLRGRGSDEAMIAGRDALCVYALLQAGYAIGDQRLNVSNSFARQIIDGLKRLPITTGRPQTYARALRASALGVYNRPEDHAVLFADVRWLIDAADAGAYTYMRWDDPQRPYRFWDNSNSQYGLLGVWAGAEAGYPVPPRFWDQVEQHWIECQATDGGWAYSPNDNKPTLTMTCAGLASLFVAHDYLEAPRYGSSVGRPPYPPETAGGLHWIEAGSLMARINPEHWGYSLYGLERVGLASGLKYLGTNDWYRTLAAQAITHQAEDGSWNGDPVDTAFALLFLSRGRHPILMNKLRFDGAWANRPRDLANLSRFASRQLERPLNWQVVDLDRDPADWMDAPVLYLASHEAPQFSDAQVAKLREYVQFGGMLFTQADGDSTSFDHWVQDLGTRLFPVYAWTDVPADHPIYNMVFVVQQHPSLRMISNGSRALIVHSPTDIAQYWQMRDERGHKSAFQLGVNLFAYSGGKTELRNRLDAWDVRAVEQKPTALMRVARLRWAGNWDPEPGAWKRFSRWLQRQTGYLAKPIEVRIEDLPDARMRLAHLTGNGPFTVDDRQVAAVGQYVRDGGVLLIDSVGGDASFIQSVRSQLLAKAFPGQSLEPLGEDHRILNASADGMYDVAQRQVRPYTLLHGGSSIGRLEFLRAGSGAVILCPLDLTSGLLATQAWGISGYQADYAQELLSNIVLWTWDGARD